MLGFVFLLVFCCCGLFVFNQNLEIRKQDVNSVEFSISLTLGLWISEL